MMVCDEKSTNTVIFIVYRKTDGLEVPCCFVLPFLNVCQTKFCFSSCDQGECNTQTFSKDRRRLIQTYLYKYVEMILRVPIQCNMAEISLNRIP